MSNYGNQYKHMGKITEDIKRMLEKEYGYDFWYNKDGDNGIIIGEGGSRNSWDMTIQIDNEDGEYFIDVNVHIGRRRR
jgi:hypothetical protein